MALSGKETLDIKERVEMHKDLVPEKYGMVLCPLCNGKGFLHKSSDRKDVFMRSVCVRCGGFGAIRKEEVLRNDAD